MQNGYAGDSNYVGIGNESMSQLLSDDEARSLLRILSENEEERIHYNAPILPFADGQFLYIQSH